MNIRAGFALGLISLITVHASTSEAVDNNHVAISKPIIKETEKTYGPDAAKRIAAWSDLIKNNKDKPVAEKLDQTNNFFNQIPVKPDMAIGDHERWSTPFEMLRHNAGSHADHVIGKYVTLEALGVNIDHLHITHVHSSSVPDRMYMVLAYYPEPTVMPLVLDTVTREIKPANERNDLFPQDSFNDDGLWLPKEQTDRSNDARAEAVAHIEAVEHLELWNKMNARMNQEILDIHFPDKKKILGALK